MTCQPITTTPTPVVSIKKYAKEISTSGDTQTAPIAVARGEAFNYYYQLQNTGSVAATGVVVKDTLPVYLTFSGAVTVRNPSNVDVSSDWTCVQGSQIFAPETISRITLVCSKKTDLPANSGVYTFTVPVVLAANAPVGVISIHNISETLGVASIGYWIAPWFRRRGAACASLELVVAYSQTIVGVNTCHANIAITNIASRKTAERAGFVELKNINQTCPDGDDMVSAVVYARSVR